MMMMMTTTRTMVEGGWLSALCCHGFPAEPRISWHANLSFNWLARSTSGKQLYLGSSTGRIIYPITCPNTLFLTGNLTTKEAAQVVSPNISSPTSSKTLKLLDSFDDEYDGIIINPEGLPSCEKIFASMLRASVWDWKLKGKKGIWLKILVENADLVPIAINEGFNYHHAEPGYVMLTYWIPRDYSCMLPASPSHQIGIGGFVMNEKKEVLVVKEKQCPCNCSGVWKLPTGYINKSEELFTGAIREVKEETGIDTTFLEVVAFRHAHLMAFEKSDLLFVCMLKPLSFDITIDEKEIQAAKWMPIYEFVGQAFNQEDDMLRRIISICVAKHENCYSGFTAQQLTSKLDGKLSFLYCNDLKKN